MSTVREQFAAAAGMTLATPCTNCAGPVFTAAEKAAARKGRAPLRGRAGQALVLSWGNPAVMERVSNALDGLGYTPTTIVRGTHNKIGDWRKEALAYIKLRHPAICFSWQRLMGVWGAEVKAALAAIGCKTIYMDFSPAGLTHYQTVILDPAGENAEASIVGGFDAAMRDGAECGRIVDATARVSDWAGTLCARAAAAGADLARLGLENLRDKPFILFAGQRPRDWVLLLDAIRTRQQIPRVVNDLIAECAKTGKFLVIKSHPQSGDMKLPANGPHHKAIQGATFGDDNDRINAWLLLHCTHLIVINSTICYQAMALNRPVATIGRGWFRGNGVATECRTLSDAMTPQPPNAKRQARFVAWLWTRSMAADAITPATIGEMIERFYPAGAALSASPRLAVSASAVDYSAIYTEVYKQPWYNRPHPRDEAVARAIAALPAVRTILDVGCGAGHLVKRLAEAGYDVHGLDGAAIARPHLTPAQQTRVQQGPATALPFPDKSQDAVTCMDVLEHLAGADLPQVLAELRRVSRRWIILTVGIGPSWATVHGKRVELHLQLKTVGQWTDYFRAAGLRLKSLEIIEPAKQQNVFVLEPS